MTLVEILQTLETSPRDHRAWRELQRLVGQLSSATLDAGRVVRHTVQIPEERREEVVQFALVAIFKHHARIPREEAKARAYVRTTLARRWLTLIREDQRTSPEPESPEPWPRGPEEEARKEAMDAIERCFEDALAQRDERYRPDLARAWQQLKDIVTGGGNTAEVLVRDGDLAPDSPRETVKRACTASYKRSERVRAELEQARTRLSETGQLSPALAERVRRVLQRFFRRCQPGARPRVKTHDSAESSKTESA